MLEPDHPPSDVPATATDAADPVVAVCDGIESARDAVRRLGESGFEAGQLSIVGRGSRADAAEYRSERLEHRLRNWGGLGGACGAVGGLLLGPVLFFAAPVGLVAAVGPVVLTLLAALEGALVGAGASVVVAGLMSLGADDSQALRYEEALRADAFLVIVHGNAEETGRARRLLACAGTSGMTGHPLAGAP